MSPQKSNGDPSYISMYDLNKNVQLKVVREYSSFSLTENVSSYDPCTAYLETYVTPTSELDSAPNFEELYLDAIAVMRERRKTIPERHFFALKLNAWLQDKGKQKKETKNRGTTYPGLKLMHVSPTYGP